MDADATLTPLLCPKRFVGCGDFCISEDCANYVYDAYDELCKDCTNEGNGLSSAFRYV